MTPRRFVGACFLCLCAVALLDRFAPLQESKATVALGNPDGMAKSCATGFNRLLANFCALASMSTSIIVADNACHTLNPNAVWGVPTSVAYAKVNMVHILQTQNSIGLNQTRLGFYSDGSCATTVVPMLGIDAREQVAAATTPLFTGGYYNFDIPLNAGLIVYKAQLTRCTSCSIGVQLIGYYD